MGFEPLVLSEGKCEAAPEPRKLPTSKAPISRVNVAQVGFRHPVCSATWGGGESYPVPPTFTLILMLVKGPLAGPPPNPNKLMGLIATK